MLVRFLAAALGRRFWISGFLSFAAGLVVPGDWTPLRGWLVPLLLGGILFFTSLKLPLGEVVAALLDRGRWRQVGLMSGVKLVLLPLAVWLIALAVAPEWAAGVALVCLMPAGLSSIAYADLVKGNHVLALLFVVASSLLTPLTVPVALPLIAPGSGLAFGLMQERALFIVLMLAVPFGLAQLLRWRFPSWINRHRTTWSPGAVLSSVLLVGVAVAVNRDAWQGIDPQRLVLPLGLCLAATALALVVGWWSRRWWGDADALAFSCGCVYLNNGLAVAVASRFFPGDPQVVLPALLISLPMLALVGVLMEMSGSVREVPPG